MTIAWDGTGGLFTRLGKIGNILNVVNQHRGTTVVADFDELGDEYEDDRDLATTLPNDQASLQNGASGCLSSLRRVAEQTAIKMVKEDNRQPDDTLATALKEIARQFADDSQSLNANTVSASVAADGDNGGDGTLVVSLKNAKGQTLEMVYDEDIVFTCLTDSQAGSATEGLESFSGKGEQAESDKLSHNWPKGSGASLSLSAVSATTDNASGNLLTNGDFEAITSNVPAQWELISGAAGTEVLEEASTVYAGTKSMKFVGTGTDPKIAQTFGDSGSGTAGSLLPNVVYHLCFWARVSAAATGTLSARIYDITNSAVLADDQGNHLVSSVNVNTLTTSYAPVRFAFQMPRILPAAYRIEIYTTTLEAAKTLYFDHVSLARASQAYLNGPYVSCHSGAMAFAEDDELTATISNDYAGEFLKLLERLYELNAKELVFATDSSGTISDGLIG